QPRTVFVVGDKKQSIYSFQGADLRVFEQMQTGFAQRLSSVGAALQTTVLEHSFRSADAILRIVDLTCDERVRHGVGGSMHHRAFHGDKPGRVDLWDVIPKVDAPDKGVWYDPVDLPSEDHHTVVLAEMIAERVRAMIDTGVQVVTRDGVRPVNEGDVLILVQ